jgi:hypothetical protein
VSLFEGYTLTYTRQLLTKQYSVSGIIDITNVSPNAQLTLSLINLVIGGQTYSTPCKSLPQTSYIMAPAEVLACPFVFPLNAAPALPSGSISGYVQTNIGRQALASPVPFSFAACTPTPAPTAAGAAVPGGSSSGTAAPPAGAAAGCTVRDIGGCVNVTDGSYISIKYKVSSIACCCCCYCSCTSRVTDASGASLPRNVWQFHGVDPLAVSCCES